MEATLEAKPDETHAWLARARSDLKAAKLLINGNAYAEALFHCQQAADGPRKTEAVVREIEQRLPRAS
jgi:hypothetical protein